MKLIDVCNPKQWKTISASELVEDGYPVFGANGIIGYFSDYNHEKPTLCITCRGATCGTVNKSLPYSYITGNSMALDDLDESVITIDFLYYFLQYRGFDDVITGSAQPQITRQSLSKIFIPEIDLNIQKNITQIIKSLEQLILNRDKQRENFNMLVKSRFNEMFILRDFPLKRLGELVEEVRYGTSLPATLNGKYGYLRMNNITEDGRLNIQNLKHIDVPEKDLEKYVVSNGDVLFNRTNSMELVGKTCIYELDFDMVIAGYIIRIRTKKNILNPRYLSEFLNFPSTKKFLRNIAKGAVNQANINAKELQDISIPLPPLSLQNEFADFVAQVDKSQLAIQKSLEELETLKKSLMQEYFG